MGKTSIASLGHSDEMEDCVGRPSERHGEHNGILERLEGHDVLWLDVPLEQLQHVPWGKRRAEVAYQ